MDFQTLERNGSRAVIARQGAELTALRLRGRDLLWDAGPLWPRHAPLLFPVVGALAGDTLRHRGAAYPMPKHGFARDRAFDWQGWSETACALALRDDDRTRAAYPFPFVLLKRVRQGRRKRQRPVLQPAPYEIFQLRFENRNRAALKLRDTKGIPIHAGDMHPKLGKTRRRNKTDITGAEDSDAHSEGWRLE